jgi:ABC-type hemin transport system ATPase subunit
MALDLCGRAVLLDGGRVVATGPTRELLSDPELLEAHGLEMPMSLLADRATGPGRSPALGVASGLPHDEVGDQPPSEILT